MYILEDEKETLHESWCRKRSIRFERVQRAEFHALIDLHERTRAIKRVLPHPTAINPIKFRPGYERYDVHHFFCLPLRDRPLRSFLFGGKRRSTVKKVP